MAFPRDPRGFDAGQVDILELSLKYACFMLAAKNLSFPQGNNMKHREVSRDQGIPLQQATYDTDLMAAQRSIVIFWCAQGAPCRGRGRAKDFGCWKRLRHTGLFTEVCSI